MKKYISMLMLAAAGLFTITSCDVETDEEPGGTSVEKMAGFWDVTVDAVDENGKVTYTDPYGLGTISLSTYNTAANTADSMWISDNKNFWGMQLKVGVNYAARTFSCPEKAYAPDAKGKCVITEGKVLENQGHNIHGMPCDSIVFKVKFDDDENGLTYQISGVRHSGFYE